MWRCVKIGQVCCCSFGGEIRVRCGFQCQELQWYVLGEFQVAAWCERHNRFTSGWDGTSWSVLWSFMRPFMVVVSFTPSCNLELPEHIPPELLTLETAPTPDLTTKTATTHLSTLHISPHPPHTHTHYQTQQPPQRHHHSRGQRKTSNHNHITFRSTHEPKSPNLTKLKILHLKACSACRTTRS